MVLKAEGQKYKKKFKKKCASINTGCDVQKQHNQSEMRVIPDYHLSQSGIWLIKLLKQELPCPVRDVQ
jgi:hypothetical protein